VSEVRASLRTRFTGHAALIVVGLMSVLPLLWVWASSLRASEDITRQPLGITWPPTFAAYARAWSEARFADYLLNSIVVAVATVALVMVVALPAAYALAMLRLPGSNAVFLLFLLGLMIPIWSIIIPLFFQLRGLGLVDTRTGAVLIESALGLPFGLFLLRAFFRELPRELFEAARIDGANHLQTLWSIVIPLARPALQALVVFEFMWSWNELVVPLFFLQSDAVRTLPIGLTFFQGRFSTDIAGLAAGTTIASLPVIIVYLLLNRHFIRGLTLGATK
jgi:ABC-type glycerol-3-phosphate transport system permease component